MITISNKRGLEEDEIEKQDYYSTDCVEDIDYIVVGSSAMVDYLGDDAQGQLTTATLHWSQVLT